jgi:hypothetical protein
VQKPSYFVSTILCDVRKRYTMQQKLLYTLVIASRKLRHYFQGHPIKVVTDRPLETILRNQGCKRHGYRTTGSRLIMPAGTDRD